MKLLITLIQIRIIIDNLSYCHDYVEFYLYNKQSQNKAMRLEVGHTKSFEGFDVTKPTRIFIHGWKTNYIGYEATAIRDAYFEYSKVNLILANWERAFDINYLKVLHHINETGADISRLIWYLVNEKKVNYSEIYVIGHSLGAHVAGMAGKLLYPHKIGVIIALDPARPGFSALTPETRVDKCDAQYVQVIHSDSGFIGTGLRERVGDGDFYPNGGSKNPHCASGGVGFTCDHSSAVDFYAESINSKINFYGIPCKDGVATKEDCECVGDCEQYRMGGDPVDVTAKGLFFLTTNRNKPYAKGRN